MQEKNKKIPLYRVRSFGEKVSVTFDFLRQNWRLWLQLSCYLLLPVSLLQALSLNTMTSGFIEGSILEESMGDMMPAELQDGAGYLISYLALILFSAIGGMIVMSMITAMMRYYREQPEGLQGATLSDMKSLLLRCLGRSALMILTMIVLSLIYVVLLIFSISMSVWIAVFGLLLLFVLVVALSLSVPVYLFEDDTTVFSAIGRGFQLGWLTWGGTFLLMFVTGFLAGIIQGVLSLPWYIGTIVKMVFMMSDSDSGASSSLFISTLLYLLAVVQCFGTFLTTSFSAVALAYQYGHAAEKHDHISVDEDIERFETMGEGGDEIANFENL